MATDLLAAAHLRKEFGQFSSQFHYSALLRGPSPGSPRLRPFSSPRQRPATVAALSPRHGCRMRPLVPPAVSPLRLSSQASVSKAPRIATRAVSSSGAGRALILGLGRGLPDRTGFGASTASGTCNNETGFGCPARRERWRDKRGAEPAASGAERGRALVARAVVGGEIALGPAVVAQVIDDLGLDALLFLLTTVIIVPTCKWLKISPILGFLGAGLVFSRMGFGQHVNEIAPVSELGILFLLFQMGIELSVDRLKELAKYSFGLGLSQIAACTLAFGFLLQPADSPISPAHLFSQASSLLTLIPPSLTSLVPALPPLPFSTELFTPLTHLTLDEIIIIAVALSLSSSAFVLNLLDEHDELGTKFGSATLGVLLMQDIAVVPLLAMLPVLEGGFTAAAGAAGDAVTTSATLAAATPMVATTAVGAAGAAAATAAAVAADPTGFIFSIAATLLGGPANVALAQLLLCGAAKALLGLGAILVGAQFLMKPAFAVVQRANAPEAFLALSLLAVTGTSLATDKLGFSDSLGAFLAGAILSSTPLKHDVALCTGPLQKLLLGLFFLTTGSSIDVDLLVEQWPAILTLLAGLLTVKTAAIALLAPRWGVKGKDAIRTALILSPGGEFAFVVLALACELGVLPSDVNRIVLIVVVLSMALTPALDALGYVLAGIGGWGESDDWVDVETVEGGRHGKVLPGEGRGLFLPAGVVDVDMGEGRDWGRGEGDWSEGEEEREKEREREEKQEMADSLEELERIASGAIPPPPPPPSLDPATVFASRQEAEERGGGSDGEGMRFPGGGMGGSAAAIDQGVGGGNDGYGATTGAVAAAATAVAMAAATGSEEASAVAMAAAAAAAAVTAAGSMGERRARVERNRAAAKHGEGRGTKRGAASSSRRRKSGRR